MNLRDIVYFLAGVLVVLMIICISIAGDLNHLRSLHFNSLHSQQLINQRLVNRINTLELKVNQS